MSCRARDFLLAEEIVFRMKHIYQKRGKFPLLEDFHFLHSDGSLSQLFEKGSSGDLFI